MGTQHNIRVLTNYSFRGLLVFFLQSTFEHVATVYQQHEFFFQVPASISEKVSLEYFFLTQLSCCINRHIRSNYNTR